MELLYNPDRMPEEELKATFVAREPLVEELIGLIAGQPDGAGVQHAVIVAPRGMGKTTVLLMVKYAIKDRGLDNRWLAVKFPEESYGVYDLADFWLETLHLIAADTADAALRQRAADLKTRYPKNDELQAAAYAMLKDWRRQHRQRLLLLVENFDQMLEQINDERDNARLRDVLMNDGTLMILGGATTFFKEVRAYDQPLYNFFKIYNLADLHCAQMQEMLRRRAMLDGLADFETTLKQNAVRLQVLEYFTGGNPRLVLMLYRVVTQSDVDEVRRALEKLLDEVTPYYKAKVEALPAQQRKILDHIARISGQTREGLTPKEIATAVRLTQNQVSSQLKRLSELGYVRSANLRGRSSYYTLSEPLYAIWHQMRFGYSVRERMNWLISFLQVWYGAEEMGMESERLDRRFRAQMSRNHLHEARALLQHHRYLTEAMASSPVRTRALERVIRGHLELQENATVTRELLAGIDLTDLTDEMLDALCVARCIRTEQVALAKAARAYDEGRAEDTLQHLKRAVQLKPDDQLAWWGQGDVFEDLGRHEEAIASYDRALQIQPDNNATWNNRGVALGHLGRYEEAAMNFDQALQIKSDYDIAWHNRGFACLYLFSQMIRQGKYNAARQKWDEALESGYKSNAENWPDAVLAALVEVAQAGHVELVRQLVVESQLEEQLFPLVRAIDYLQTGDEALVEKLSPEVRGIVEEVVVKLRATVSPSDSAKGE